MRNKKILFWGMGLGIILMALVVWPRKKERVETGIVTPTEEEKRELPEMVKNPKQISFAKQAWANPIEEGVEIGAIKNKVDQTKMEIFLSIVGLSWEKRTNKGEYGWWFFGDGIRNALVDVNNGRWEYGEDIKKMEAESERKSGSELISDLKKKVKQMVGEDLVVEIEGSENKKLVYPRWVVCNEAEVQAIEIRANFKWNKHKILGMQGDMITGLYSLNGKLIKLSIEWPFEKLKTERTIEMKNIKEIRAMTIRDWGIVGVEGGKNYQLGEGESVGEVRISNLGLGYIFDSESSKLLPYLIADGNSLLRSGPVKVRLIARAEK
jgi:hypothetical protein